MQTSEQMLVDAIKEPVYWSMEHSAIAGGRLVSCNPSQNFGASCATRR